MRCKNLLYLAVGIGLGSIASLIVALHLTTPDSGGLMAILLVFILIYLISFAVILFFATLGYYAYRLVRPLPVSALKADKEQLCYHRLVTVCVTLSFVPIALISFNSIGRLNFMDIALLTIVELIANTYILKLMK